MPDALPAGAALLERQIAQLLDSADPSEAVAFWGRQFDLGLAWVHFPPGAGGLGLPREFQTAVSQRLSAAGAPENAKLNKVGLEFAAPTLITHGTPAQRARYLRPIFTCEEIWCQLFSEPGAGSDLAGLSTRAIRDGAHWVVNGQKVWTSFAQKSQQALLLARTDIDAPKHKGLTYFIVDMGAPGVQVKPLRQMTGESEFNEVYLDDVVVPEDQQLGELGDGWRVAITTLMNERQSWAAAETPRETLLMRQALTIWRDLGWHDNARRDQLLQLWVRTEASRLNGIRITSGDRAPGPEGSVPKIVSAELNKRITSFAVDLLGPDGLLYPGYDAAPAGANAERTDQLRYPEIRHAFLRTRANSIEAGSTEINKNIVAERVLGLPGDIKVDRTESWRNIRRG